MRPTNFQKISRIHNFKIPEDFYRFLHSDPVYLRTSYFSVLADIYRAVMLAPEIIVILFTRGLPCVQCTRNLLTCENNIADYKNFPGVSTKFQEISSISRSNFKFQQFQEL